MSSQWIVVTKGKPCPMCGKPDRCKVSPDGERVLCFRAADENAEWQLVKHNQNSAQFRRRGAVGRPSAVVSAASTPASTPRRTDLSPEQLHDAYTRLFGMLILETPHRKDLKRRGLSAEEIEGRGYRSMPPSMGGRSQYGRNLLRDLGDTFDEVPGFGRSTETGTPAIFGAAGIAIPCRNVDGKIVAVKIRNSNPVDKFPKYSYLSSSKHEGTSPGAVCHVPLGVVAPAPIVRITEGELKADVAFVLSGVPTISFPGASTWHLAIPVLRALSATTVRVAFDADYATNPDVARPFLECVRGLTLEGFTVEVERWDGAVAKGIDDLLVKGGASEVVAGEAAIAAAEEVAKAAGVEAAAGATESSAELRGRVYAVLATGDPAALFRPENSELLNDVAKLAILDRTAYSEIRVECRKAKVPMKDWDFALKKPIAAFANEQRPESSRDTYGGFFIDPPTGCISRTRNTPDGPKTVQMCTFAAHIVYETIYDDGAETRRVLGIEGQLSPANSSGRALRLVEVAAEEFDDMRWVVRVWGTDAIVHPGEVRSLPSAIKLLSQSNFEVNKKPKQIRTVYEHTGWRQFDSGWGYLHAGGVISASGTLRDLHSVRLSPPLDRYQLPQPPEGDELKKAIMASLALLTIGPRRLMFPLLAATYRAALGSCDFGLSLVGQTGLGKSELAALAQRHFGPTLDARHLPASWSSTANSIERQLFLAKDTLTTVDDYAPAGNHHDVAKYRQAAERVLRSQGNNAGRGRMRHDGSLQPANPPRGLVLSTGEDVAGGQSVRARQMILDVSPGSFTLAALTPHQHRAEDGLFAAAMAGFIRWVAPRYNKIQQLKKQLVHQFRDKAKKDGHHARTPGIVAELFFGFSLFLRFAEQSGTVTLEQSNRLKAECWAALLAAAGAQETHQAAADHVQEYLRFLHSILVSQRAHVDDADSGGPPALDSRSAWGWRKGLIGGREEWQPQGKRIGWIDDDFVYLDPGAAYQEVQDYAAKQNTALPVTQPMLSRLLKDRGLLVITGESESRRTPTIRRKFRDADRQAVLCLRIESITEAKDANVTTAGVAPASAADAINPDEPSRFPDFGGAMGAKEVTNVTNDADNGSAGHNAGHYGHSAGPPVTTTNGQKTRENTGKEGSGHNGHSISHPLAPVATREEYEFL